MYSATVIGPDERMLDLIFLKSLLCMFGGEVDLDADVQNVE